MPHRQQAPTTNDERKLAYAEWQFPFLGFFNGRAYLGAILIPPSNQC